MNIQYHVSLFMLKSITTINKTWFIFWKIFKDVPNLFCRYSSLTSLVHRTRVSFMQNAYRLHLFEDQSGLRCYNKHRRERKEREIVSLYYILDILRIKRAGLSVLQYFDLVSPLPPLPPKKSWKNSPYKTTLL